MKVESKIRAAVVFLLVIFISACGLGDGAERLGNGYVYVDNGSLSRYIENEDKKMVKDIVVSYGRDSEYIYALRQVENSYYCPSGDGQRKEVYVTNNFEYWVIKMDGDKLLGPFNQEQFDEFYKRLGRDKKYPISSINNILINNYAVSPTLATECDNPVFID